MIQIRRRARPPRGLMPASDLADQAKRKAAIPLPVPLVKGGIDEIFFTDEVKKAALTLVNASLDKKSVPEVGGLLFGSFSVTEDRFTLLVDKFLAAENAAFQSSSKLVFGEIVMDEVDDYLLQFPHQALLGWLHTHPGHGVYLSDIDLSTHQHHFYQHYQIAVVIDSLTTDLTTGVFARSVSKADVIISVSDIFFSWINLGEHHN